eukprot:NODE_1941_length_1177_cov_43.145714_g1925_i0.p1 GENE.NODE_1941_length_1177_cov_43.145714_g1925_i0~~NODE_1941_length_1177_cov_43.145714_g1925_i0.p1  ORF type:complete len:245 (+),score=58.90 NODE_1941_length_1177_cov_43.145714_g1925_i0:95-829(+)
MKALLWLVSFAIAVVHVAAAADGNCQIDTLSGKTVDFTNVVHPYKFKATLPTGEIYTYSVSICNLHMAFQWGCSAKGFIQKGDSEGAWCFGSWSDLTEKDQVSKKEDGVLYTYRDSASGGRLYLNITCNPDIAEDLIVFEDGSLVQTGANFNMTVGTSLVCGVGGGGGSPGGFIILLLMLFGVVGYCAGGIFYNYKQREMRGVEMIPNLAFWRDLPLLVRDGFMFAFHKIRSKTSSSSDSSLYT